MNIFKSKNFVEHVEDWDNMSDSPLKEAYGQRLEKKAKKILNDMGITIHIVDDEDSAMKSTSAAAYQKGEQFASLHDLDREIVHMQFLYALKDG